MKVRLFYQTIGRYKHWVMELSLDFPDVFVKTKVLYQHYSHPSFPPPPAVTLRDLESLRRTAHAAAEIQAAA